MIIEDDESQSNSISMQGFYGFETTDTDLRATLLNVKDLGINEETMDSD
jgi:hypothetical protein